MINKEHKITHWNKALERLTGYPAEDMIGTNRQWAPFYEKERPAMADVILDQIGETQMQQLYGSKWRRSALIDDGWEAEAYFPNLGENGKICWFTAAPIKMPDGQVVGAIETLWDKTEERQAAKEQERHTQELAALCSIYATKWPLESGGADQGGHQRGGRYFSDRCDLHFFVEGRWPVSPPTQFWLFG